MNHYIMIRRLRMPAILLLIGGVWLLHQTGVLDHPWHWFWPLLLILLGVLMLAERAALAAVDGDSQAFLYPGQAGIGTVDPQSTTDVPLQDSGKNPEGGQS
jgi:hypothetical protein